MEVYLLHALVNEQHEKRNSNFNTIDEVLALNPDEVVLTFDGVYQSVYKNWQKLRDYKVILFQMGDNDKKVEELCTPQQLEEMVKDGAVLGWHTWNHNDLTKLSEEQIQKEILSPFETEYFAYPYGRFNDRVIDEVKNKYKFAYSVTEGNDSDYQIKRKYLGW